MENTKILEFLLLNPNSVKDNPNVEKVSLEYLPFSTGFEIECFKLDEFKLESFTNIENILDVNVDSCEQRFRIPKGYNGFKCLYEISKQLKYNSELNPLSGIHYHVDFTDCFEVIKKDTTILDSIKPDILTELDTWGYKGNYNPRDIGEFMCYIRLNSQFKTFEFRIGEMTFDYALLCKRIIHCNQLSVLIKNAYSNNDFGKAANELPEEEIKAMIANRVKKL